MRRLGLDRNMLGLAAGFSVAALLALSIAAALGFDNPYWAGVAVWVTAGQPSRGLLLYRVMYRLLGTALGSAVGLLIVYLVHQPILVVLALAVWLTLCATIGNLFRQFRAYAWFLSGYTAAIVVLPSFFDTAHLHHFAEARVACNFIGTFCVIAVMLALRPASTHDAALSQVDTLVDKVRAWVAAVLRGDATAADPAVARQLVVDIATVEDAADAAARPSLGAYRAVRDIRHVAFGLLALVSSARALLERGGPRPGPDSDAAQALAALLDARAAASSEVTDDQRQASEALLAFEATPRLAGIAAAVRTVTVNVQKLKATERTEPADTSDRALFYYHDWHAARVSALRTALAVLAVGLFWVVTGWSNGALALIGTSIFVTVFSNLETARQQVEIVVKGSIVGFLAALVAAVFVVPHVRSEAQLLLAVTPFIVLGALAFAHPKTARPALDANAVFLMSLQLSWPPAGDVWHTLSNGFALLAGMSIPWLAFYLLPLRPAQRVDALIGQIVRDLERFRDLRDEAALPRHRTRLHHSVMRLALRLSARLNDPLLDDALAALGTAERVRSKPAPNDAPTSHFEENPDATSQQMLDEAMARLLAYQRGS